MPQTCVGGSAFGLIVSDESFRLTPCSWPTHNHSANQSTNSPNYNVMQSASVSSLPVGNGK